MGLRLITAPAVEPISVAELKVHARGIDDAIEDALLAIFIKHARERAEAITATALVTQTWEQTLDAFPEAEIELLKPPVTAITSVKYIDTAGVEQTIAGANYLLETSAERFPGWLLPAYGYEWPETRDQANAVVIRYATGYPDAASVPAPIRAWCLLTAAFLYANREAFVVDGKVTEVPGRFVDGMLDPYRVFKV